MASANRRPTTPVTPDSAGDSAAGDPAAGDSVLSDRVTFGSAPAAAAPEDADDVVDAPPPPSPVVEQFPRKSVGRSLYEAGYEFDFFQAVRLLRQHHRRSESTDRRRTDAVRFRAHASLSFPPSSIYEIDPPRAVGRPAEMVVAFMGLTGPSGVLPRHYTDLMMQIRRQRKREEREVLRDWFDLFNHRLIHLFYQAWEKYRFYVPFERRDYDLAEEDTFTKALFSLIGLGTPSHRKRLRVAFWKRYESAADEFEANEYGSEQVLAQVDDFALLHFAGLLSHRRRTAVGLEQILAAFFKVPVQVQQFQGHWIKFEDADRSRLGSEGSCSSLGVDLVIGERMWDVQSKIRIKLGPLNYRQFVDFLPDRTPVPGRKALFLLSHLVRFYLGSQYDFDAQLLLHPDSVPACRLSSSDSLGARLGWNTWLLSWRPDREVDDVVLQEQAVVWVNRDVLREPRRPD